MSLKQSVDTILCARYIIPIIPKNQVLESHAIVIRNGNILALLPIDIALNSFTSCDIQHFNNHVIMPGLINAHGHAAMSLFRGLADDLPLMTWLQEYIWPAESKWVSESFVYDGTRYSIAEMIRSGTTCFSDMYFFPESAARAISESGIRAQLCCPILDFPTPWGSGPEEYIEKTLSLHQANKNNCLTIAFGPHAPYTVSDTPLLKIKELALLYSLPIQIHLHETQNEVDEAIKNYGSRPINRLESLGYFKDPLQVQCVHMTSLNDEDFNILKNSNAHVIHCPESNLKLASGFCEANKLLNLGINLAIGTDGAASNNDLDMFSEMRTAALLAKGVAQDASVLDAPKALEMCTINGAKALSIDSYTGSLESGKSADIIAIDLHKLNSRPIYNLHSTIVYSLNSSQVSDSWVAGRRLLKNSILQTLDENELIQLAEKWSAKIQSL